MSDRQNDVLAAIDAETAKCICGNTIPADGPSLDYCSDVCQYGYTAQQAGTEPDDEFTFHINQGPTDGHTINEEVNAWFEQTTGRRPGARTVTVPIRVDIAPITEAARQLRDTIAQTLADAAASSAATFEELAHAVAPETREEEQSDPCNPCQGHTLGTQHDGRTRVMYVPNIADPNAPTRAELDAGTTIGILDEDGRLHTETPAVFEPDPVQRSTHTRESFLQFLEALPAGGGTSETMQRWEDAVSQVASAGRISLAEAARNLGAVLQPAPEPPATGEEFRRRALEARHNRGTGPTQPRQRQPRNHQR